jgi:hypothetical protein
LMNKFVMLGLKVYEWYNTTMSFIFLKNILSPLMKDL